MWIKQEKLLNEVCTCGCQGTGKIKEYESEQTDMESLKKYEDELENELSTVRQRLKELKTDKK